MNIGEEKEHIYNIMRDITNERKKLTEIYFSLKERLDDLNKLEIRGLEDLSIKGYVDLHNKVQKEVISSNVRREAEHVIKKVEEEFQEESEKTVIPKAVISEQRFHNNKNKNVGKYSSFKIDQITDIVISILKDAGKPLHIQELSGKVAEQTEGNVKPLNFKNNVIARVMKKEPRIEKAMRGYYQYRG